MSFTKFKELKVRHGTYKASDGSERQSWSTVGRIMYEDEEKRYSVYINPDRISQAMSSLKVDQYGYVRLAAFDPRPDSKKDTKKFQEKTQEYFNQDIAKDNLNQAIDDEIPF